MHGGHSSPDVAPHLLTGTFLSLNGKRFTNEKNSHPLSAGVVRGLKCRLTQKLVRLQPLGSPPGTCDSRR